MNDLQKASFEYAENASENEELYNAFVAGAEWVAKNQSNPNNIFDLIDEMEIINLSTENGKLHSLLSYRDSTRLDSITNGYDNIIIPVNIRKLQFSERENLLVDQSIKINSEEAQHSPV